MQGLALVNLRWRHKPEAPAKGTINLRWRHKPEAPAKGTINLRWRVRLVSSARHRLLLAPPLPERGPGTQGTDGEGRDVGRSVWGRDQSLSRPAPTGSKTVSARPWRKPLSSRTWRARRGSCGMRSMPSLAGRRTTMKGRRKSRTRPGTRQRTDRPSSGKPKGTRLGLRLDYRGPNPRMQVTGAAFWSSSVFGRFSALERMYEPGPSPH